MTVTNLSQDEKVRRGAEDSGRYFRSMMDFVGFTVEDARAIRESGLVVEKHLPQIVSEFYAHLLRYPPTRKPFIKPDGTVDEDYLQKRMYHLTNFWRRTAAGVFDDDYARYVDYVGRAHTSHGADPNIYIAERYVIGQVGFIQHAIGEALHNELHEYDPEFEKRATRAWNLLLMVILEILARAYNDEHEGESGPLLKVNRESMKELAVETYERGLGLERPARTEEVAVAAASEIPDGARKIFQFGELSIGVFHHKGQWYAVRNHCLHRGGPVATGSLDGDVLTCPWHGYQYDLTSGQLLVDPSSRLDTYPLALRDGQIYLTLPHIETAPTRNLLGEPESAAADSAPGQAPTLQENEFLLKIIPPGKIGRVRAAGQEVAVYNIAGHYFATSNLCTHADGPLNEGELKGQVVECPLHGSCFDVTTGAVMCGPADQPLAVFKVVLDGQVGRIL